MTSTTRKLTDLGTVAGSRLVGYVLATDSPESVDAAKLTSEQQTVVDEFDGLVRGIGAKAGGRDFVRSLLAVLLDGGEDGCVLINRWRVRCGGAAAEIASSSAAEAALLELGAQAYPAFLFLTRDAAVADAPSESLNLGTLATRFIEAVENDQDLGAWFPKNRKEGRSWTWVASSVGIGTTIELSSWAECLLRNAWYLATFRFGVGLTGFLDSLRAMFALAKGATDGKSMPVPLFLVLTGVALPPATRVDFGNGTHLRAWREDDALVVPPSSLPRQSESDVRDGCVLETSWPVFFRLGGELGDIPSAAKTHAALEDLLEDLSVALALCKLGTPPVMWRRAWTWSPNPGSGGGYRASDEGTQTQSTSEGAVFSAGEATELGEWATRVRAADDKSIRIAKRRLVSAIGVRTDPVDGFVDAVIGWENLFGADTELSLRISVALANLLEPTFDGRVTLQRRAKELYAKRSRVVHGAMELSRDEAQALRLEAIEILQRSLRALYPRAELLRDKERSLRLLLGPLS